LLLYSSKKADFSHVLTFNTFSREIQKETRHMETRNFTGVYSLRDLRRLKTWNAIAKNVDYIFFVRKCNTIRWRERMRERKLERKDMSREFLYRYKIAFL
jgi:hypothetical protein